MSLPQFKVLRPRTVEEAISLLDDCGQHAGEGPFDSRSGQVRATRIVAGGTDLAPSMQQKLFEPQYVLDIRHIPELKGIRQTEEGTEIGALTTLTQIEHSDFLRQHYSVLAEAAKTVASPILRNMGTIGGNICLDTRCLWYNQSLTWRKSCGFCIKKDGDLCHVAPGGTKCWAAFSADTPAALLCLEAELEIVGPPGFRRTPISQFFFFSSRRRHTRFDCDWSSDVCSSDLLSSLMALLMTMISRKEATDITNNISYIAQSLFCEGIWNYRCSKLAEWEFSKGITRSEERRVGKECRSRWSPYH